MWIPQIHERFAVPDWVKEINGTTKFGSNLKKVGPEWFPRRPGLAGDFGLALDMLESIRKNGLSLFLLKLLLLAIFSHKSI